MFKEETYYSWPKDVDWAAAISNIHAKLKEEFKLEQASYGFRKWDHSFSINKGPTEHYTCDSHDEFKEVISSVKHFTSFMWHNIYKPISKPPKKFQNMISFGAVDDLTDERFGVGIDFSKSSIEIAAHAKNNLGYIERVLDIVRKEISLESPSRIDDDPYRRKMCEPNIFIARHFDDKGNSYYSDISNFLSLVGFNVLQGEEYTSDSIPPKSCKRFSQCENQYFPLPRLAKSDNRYPFFSNCGSAIVLL